jgi:cytochrome d ubiquinol oxidase subunit I
MDLDVVLLARLQFALTIMVHYLFPPLSIGLGAQLVIMEGMYLRTKDPRWEALTRFFTKLFAVNFAVGVATGIVMELEFGTNWATYSRFVGDVFGSALASEGIFAFFLESGFLAVLVFGWDRVSPRVHFFSTVMVFLGSVFSSVWIVIANSWMHTPAGYHLVPHGDGVRAEITDFWAMVFNPSAMHRLNHVLLGAFILGAFFVMSVSAWYVLKNRHLELAKRSFMVGLIFGAISSCAIGLSGHSQAVALAHNQPAKLAAFEGHFETGEGPTDLYVIGWPDVEAREVRYGIALPGMLTFLVHSDFETPIPGLDRVPEEDQPPVVIPFLTYHTMAALGGVFVGLTLLGLFFAWRRTLFTKRWLMWAFVLAVPLPYVANQAGWIATEVGRQPWVVQGLLRTSDAVSRSVPGEQVLGSIILFGLIYIALVALWLVVMNEKIKHGPDEPKEQAPAHTTGKDLVEVAARLSSPGSPYSLTGNDEDGGT